MVSPPFGAQELITPQRSRRPTRRGTTQSLRSLHGHALLLPPARPALRRTQGISDPAAGRMFRRSGLTRIRVGCLVTVISRARDGAPPRDGVAGAPFPDLRGPLACSGGGLVGSASGGGLRHHRPADAALGVRVGQDGSERLSHVPSADLICAAHTRPSLPEPRRQIPPRTPGPVPVRDPVDDPAVTGPTVAALPSLGQMRLQPGPLLVREISPPHGHDPLGTVGSRDFSHLGLLGRPGRKRRADPRPDTP